MPITISGSTGSVQFVIVGIINQSQANIDSGNVFVAIFR